MKQLSVRQVRTALPPLEILLTRDKRSEALIRAERDER